MVATIILVAGLLAKLSNVYRANRRARGLEDTGHYVLETVLVVSAGHHAGGVRHLVLLLGRRQPGAGWNPDLELHVVYIFGGETRTHRK